MLARGCVCLGSDVGPGKQLGSRFQQGKEVTSVMQGKSCPCRCVPVPWEGSELLLVSPGVPGPQKVQLWSGQSQPPGVKDSPLPPFPLQLGGSHSTWPGTTSLEVPGSLLSPVALLSGRVVLRPHDQGTQGSWGEAEFSRGQERAGFFVLSG